MSNRLITETSPYLLQHAENPVEWYPWGDEAFEKARAEDRPVFLSVGYSACHWCHVMEHESFEDEATAAVMNQHFVSIKVDREERPDVDAIYMDAVHAMTGRGGWPMSVFLTPDAVPFYAGTYFPDTPRHGMPSFTQVLTQIAGLWEEQRDEVTRAGANLMGALEQQGSLGATGSGPLDSQTLDDALTGLKRSFDSSHGGWGDAPKFPQPGLVEFLLRRHHATENAGLLAMATLTLDVMMQGGIHDQLGGGFHRYATDEIWLVPHFEKMLYDNAQLARLYLHAWQVTGAEPYRRVATQTLDYVAREMLDPSGGFYSAQDADSEGEEGRFFVWTPEQIRSSLEGSSDDFEADARLFETAHGVVAGGNFEGDSILFVAHTIAELAESTGASELDLENRLDRIRAALMETREERVRPGLDDKVLSDWNGLMLAAFAEAGRVLDRDDYRDIAEKNAEFILTELRDPRGRLLHTWKGGKAKLNGYLADYAHCADGLLELYQTTFDERWFVAARELADSALVHFADSDGGFFDTSDDHESLILRPKGLQDGAVPSGGAALTGVLLRLAALTGEGRYADAAESALAAVQPLMGRAPQGFAQWLAALDCALAPSQEVAVVGDEPRRLLDEIRARFRPNLVVAAGPSGRASSVPLLAGRDDVDGRCAAYVCQHFSCEQPVTDAAALGRLLD